MKPSSIPAFLLIPLLFPLFLHAQELSTQSKRARKFFETAITYTNSGEYDKALAEAKKAAEEDPAFIEAHILQGDIYSGKKMIPEAVEAYNDAIRINPEYAPNLYYVAANLEQSIGLYKDARDHFLKFLGYRNIPSDKKKTAADGIKSCEYGIAAMEHPVPFHPVNLGDSINTPMDEYMNAITSDEQRLYFTRKVPRHPENLEFSTAAQEDFYFADRCDSGWHLARNLGPPINTEGNEGAMCISPDGRYLFFAACERPEGFGSCDLYWSKKEGDHWSEPVNMGEPVNSPEWDTQPSFSSDGKTLYFVSKRPGGKGSSDIWKTELQPDGTWTVPVNLGDSINTPHEEMSPFIHPDDRTLYFSSNGHEGMGKLDIFYSRKDENGNWRKPVNLGYPINTYADEISLVVNATGNIAYISSDKFGGKGRMDIYSFPLYPEARPVPVTYFKGIVFDSDTKRKLDASFELIDLETGKTIAQSVSDAETGEFLLVLPTEKNYALNVSRQGYLFYSDHFELRGQASQAKPFLKNIPLQPLKVGETVILKNIFFDTDKYELKPESVVELKKLIDLLRKNPSLHIEISGHTDNVGTPEYNMTLSGNRAKAVYDYLVNNGIAKDRLTYAGYGLTRPIDTNDTEEGRANNRRTEFKVVTR
ncbi:MAG TPA: OmpA family protein [Bacteroidales bacterium]|nr:OmpA family protein [Bacteroidales bacterium]